MPKIMEPTTQAIYPHPLGHSNYFYSSNNILEEYRTSRYLNNIVKIFGDDKIVRGCNVTYSFNSVDALTLTMTPGVLIQDSTLLEITNTLTRSFNTISFKTKYSNNFAVILYTTFSYPAPTSIPTSNPKSFSITAGILNTSNGFLYTQDPNNSRVTATRLYLNSTTNRTVLFAAKFLNLDAMLDTITTNGRIFKVARERVGSTVFNYNTSFSPYNVDGCQIQ